MANTHTRQKNAGRRLAELKKERNNNNNNNNNKASSWRYENKRVNYGRF